MGAASGNVRAEPLSQETRMQILGELDSIEEVVTGKRISSRKSAVEMFQSASASDKAAYEFYLQCVKVLRFDKKGASFNEYREWREKNEDDLKDGSKLLAMRLQLQYLVLTLRAAEGVDRRSLVPELETFVANIVTHYEDLEGAGWRTMREPVNRTVFAEAYDLNQSLEVSDWHYAPGDFAAVYQRTIFPYLRAENPQELIAAWDRRIQLELKFIEASREEDEGALAEFQKDRLPRLHWEKATDVFQSVSQSEGANAMLRILRSHSDHPDATKWLKKARGLFGSGESP